MTEIQIIFDHLDKACCPEDVFGAGDPMIVFKKLSHACHPDLHDDPLAKLTFQKLHELREEAKKRVEAGEYGKKIPLAHCVPLVIGEFTVKPKPAVGDVADLYRAEGDKLLVKVARSHDDNDLMRAEVKALGLLDGIKGPVRSGVPVLHKSFQVDGRWKREASAIEFFPGFVTAQEVHAKMTVDARTAVWMFKRVLSLLTWVHHFGLVHGAILPPHVMFYPDNDGSTKNPDPRKHSIRLIDWCYSVDFTSRTRLSSWVPAWKDHYAPELLTKKSIGPSSDLYMAATLIHYLCGRLPERLENVLSKCLLVDPTKRYQKASEVLEIWISAAMATFGAPKWHEFNL